ncbi:hypothetical protein [Clostridium nigeriense]
MYKKVKDIVANDTEYYSNWAYSSTDTKMQNHQLSWWFFIFSKKL